MSSVSFRCHSRYLGVTCFLQVSSVTSSNSRRGLVSTCQPRNQLSKYPLSKAPPGLEHSLQGNSPPNTHPETYITRLANGLTVASEDHWGQFATLGVLTNSGSRTEVGYISGMNHFLEKLAFNSTSRYESREAILMQIEKDGGIFDCQSSRDTMIHAISVGKDSIETAVTILSEVILQPQFTQEEIVDAQQAIAFELENIHMNPNKELRLVELIHAAAYDSNTVGLPKICPAENLSVINRDHIFTYLKNQCVPEEMVLAASGIPHQLLVDLANKYFTPEPVWNSLQLDNQYKKDISIAQYTGGIVKVDEDLSNVSLGPTPMPELAHVVMAVESCSHKDDDFVAYCVLNTLMGGGGSFSAGGPGKGMYTRLYTNVLNKYFWIDNAVALNHAYSDTGLFAFHGSSHPSKLSELTAVLAHEMKRMAGKVDETELSRAKRQLQSMMMMNLESRPIIFEDIGRQVLSTGERKPAQFFYDQIESIQASDIQRVANRMLKSRLSVAALGTLDKLPQYEQMQDMVSMSSPTRFSLFSR